MGVLKVCVLFLRAMLIPKAHLAIENLALCASPAILCNFDSRDPDAKGPSAWSIHLRRRG